MPLSRSAKLLVAALTACGVALTAQAEAPIETRTPQICEMLDAFDRALQHRYYKANFAPAEFGCSFVREEGCVFETPRRVTIRVTHVRDLGCDDDGKCSFEARQVCEAKPNALYACQTLMFDFAAFYEVNGDYSESLQVKGRWSLDDWSRTPAPVFGAAEHEVDAVCPRA